MTPIVVGCDGSSCSTAALDAAVDLAAALGDSIVVAYAVEPPFRSVGEEWREYRNALEERGRAVTDEAVARARARGVEAEPTLVAAKPADALLELADERGSWLIVVGTSSERPLTGAILGSVPHKLLHRSKIPVLVVPAG